MCVAVYALVRSGVPMLRVVAVALVLGCTYALTIGQSATSPLRPGQIAVPKPLYGEVFGTSDDTAEDLYKVASDLHEIVPEPPHAGVPLLMWTIEHWSERTSVAAAEYGWSANVLRGLPTLDTADVLRIRAVRPDVLVLLTDSAAEIPLGVRNLLVAFPGSSARPARTVQHGATALYVCIVDMSI